MTIVSATTARANLYRLLDQVNDESEPLTITGQRGHAVLAHAWQGSPGSLLDRTQRMASVEPTSLWRTCPLRV